MGVSLSEGNDSRRVREIKERWSKATNFEEPDRVPIQIDVAAPLFCKVLGYTLKDLYRNLAVCRKIQIEGPQWAYRVLGDDRLPNVPNMEDPPLPPTGSIAEGIAFDCEIRLPDDESPWLSPWIIPKLKTPEDLEKAEVPDPKECVERWEKHYLKAFGVKIPVKGGLTIHPPLSAAGSLMGTMRLYTYLYKYPDLMHSFLQKLLKTFFELMDYRDAQLGTETRSIGLSDDHAGYLSEDMYRKFVLPYNKQIYEKYGKEGRGLHMDSQSDHVAYILLKEYRIQSMDLGFEADIAKIKEVFDGKVFFNGNLNSKLLVLGTEKELRKATEHCIYSAAPGGGYAFDVGGEAYAGIDVNRLLYVINYAKKIGRYPIRPNDE